MSTSLNDQIIEAWNDVLFPKWARFRYLVTDGLAAHGEALMDRCDLAAVSTVLDVGCGFGDTTRRLAAVTQGRVTAVGVDVAAGFVHAAASETPASMPVRFVEADAQHDDLGGPYDLVFSRFGTMFFGNPMLALRNLRRATADDGQLAMVVWRKREDNEWLYAAEEVVREFLTPPEETDQPTCGPGPFSLAGADFTSNLLRLAGFERICLERFDTDICIGRNLEEAVEFAMSLGPAGEIVRLCGDEGLDKRAEVEAALRDRFDALPRDAQGHIHASSSVWLVTARPAT